MYVCLPLSLRNVEDLLDKRSIEVSHETVRFWWMRFGPLFVAEIRRKRVSGICSSRWCWHLDEVFVKINGVQHYLWPAVDHEGRVAGGLRHRAQGQGCGAQVNQETAEAARAS
jgi:putative transposase